MPKAWVKVQNNTGVDLEDVVVVHKYSNKHMNFIIEKFLGKGQSAWIEVEFETGSFTTGRDWWYVQFKGYGRHYYRTQPHNARAVLDALESCSRTFAEALADALKGPKGAAIGAANALLWGSGLLNYGETAGFKQHILRDEDANNKNEIVLWAVGGDDKCEFKSPSGSSWTRLQWYMET